VQWKSADVEAPRAHLKFQVGVYLHLYLLENSKHSACFVLLRRGEAKQNLHTSCIVMIAKWTGCVIWQPIDPDWGCSTSLKRKSGCGKLPVWDLLGTTLSERHHLLEKSERRYITPDGQEILQKFSSSLSTPSASHSPHLNPQHGYSDSLTKAFFIPDLSPKQNYALSSAHLFPEAA
jgi:hypothetical protein